MAVALTVVRPGSARAQTIDDGVMMAKGELFTGALYTHDQWDQVPGRAGSNVTTATSGR